MAAVRLQTLATPSSSRAHVPRLALRRAALEAQERRRHEVEQRAARQFLEAAQRFQSLAHSYLRELEQQTKPRSRN